MSNPLQTLILGYPSLESCRTDLKEAYRTLLEAFRKGNKLLLCGNGGSAADCSHIASELMKGFMRKRPLPPKWRKKLGASLASRLQGGLPVLPLPAFHAPLTAFSNDCHPLYGFAQLTWALGKENDVLLCLSTSGNSANILKAAEVAGKMGLRTIALTGRSGGRLKKFAHPCIRVPETEVYKIQELHLPVYHCLCRMLEEALFPNL